jgi:hypothetical protein
MGCFDLRSTAMNAARSTTAAAKAARVRLSLQPSSEARMNP